MAQRIPCYICSNALIPRLMPRIHGEAIIIKRDIAIARRDVAGRPPLAITPETRICNNCNISIFQEIQILDNDPECLRLNVLSQTSSVSCLVCSGYNTHTLTPECRGYVFIKKEIYIPRRHICCNVHLDERSF